MTVVTRFAPSPTGLLHVGNARTALLAWLHARAHGGQFVLRIDDTDRARSTAAYTDAIVRDLAWLGLDWDALAQQSARTELHAHAFAALRAAGRVYPAYDTGEELAGQRAAARAAGRPPVYDRRALRLSEAERAAFEAAGRRPHWRFRLSDGAARWRDLIQGDKAIPRASLSDPVVRRDDGTFTYVFASCVDDIDLGVTTIVRGEDHVTNTAVQLDLMAALAALRPLAPTGNPLRWRAAAADLATANPAADPAANSMPGPGQAPSSYARTQPARTHPPAGRDSTARPAADDAATTPAPGESHGAASASPPAADTGGTAGGAGPASSASDTGRAAGNAAASAAPAMPADHAGQRPAADEPAGAAPAAAWQPPTFAHLPLLADAEGKGLSKRLGSLSLAKLRQDGLEPQAVAAVLVALGTAQAPRAIRALDDLLADFSLDAYGRATPKLDAQAFHQLNAQIVHDLSFQEVKPRLANLAPACAEEAFWLAVRENCATVAEAATWCAIVSQPLTPVIAEDDRAWLAQAAAILPARIDADSFKAWRAELQAATSRKGRALFQPLRLALTGREHGPGLQHLLALIGPERARARLRGETA